jgi:hypothetical protein
MNTFTCKYPIGSKVYYMLPNKKIIEAVVLGVYFSVRLPPKYSIREAGTDVLHAKFFDIHENFLEMAE